MRPYLTSVLTSFLLAFILYSVVAHFWGEANLIQKVSSVGYQIWIPVLALSLLNYLLRYYRWTRYIALNSKCTLPNYQHMLVYFSGFALTTTPGKAGEALRSLYLNHAGVSISQSLSALFAERLVDLATIAALALLIVDSYYQGNQTWLLLSVAVAACVIFAVIHSPYLRLAIIYCGNKLGGITQKFSIHLVDMLAASKQMLLPKELTIGTSISVVAWTAEGVGLYLILQYLGVEIGLAAAIGIYAVSMLVGALSFIPGGLGSTELAMGALLVALGADQGTAITATLVCRIATLWFAVGLGMISAFCLTLLGITPKIGSAAQ